MSDLLSRVESRVMPTKDVRICLDLNLLAERDALRSARPSGDRMVTPKDARLDEVEEAIRAASITLRVRGVDRVTYHSWMLACPPRKGTVGEAFDPTKFFMHAARSSAVYVDAEGVEHDITADEWAAIDKTLTDGEHDRIAQAVMHVNRTAGSDAVDFIVRDSETTRDSFGISGSRGASASRPAASGGGNRKKSTSKSSTKKAAGSSK